MSIRAEWQKLVREGVLFRLEPFPGDPCARTILMTQEVHEVLTKEMPEGPEANRRSRLLGTLQAIIAGRRLVVCMTPFAARKAVMGRLDRVEGLGLGYSLPGPSSGSCVLSFRGERRSVRGHMSAALIRNDLAGLVASRRSPLEGMETRDSSHEETVGNVFPNPCASKWRRPQ